VRGSKFSTQLAAGAEAYTISSVPSDANGVEWRSFQWVSIQHCLHCVSCTLSALPDIEGLCSRCVVQLYIV